MFFVHDITDLVYCEIHLFAKDHIVRFALCVQHLVLSISIIQTSQAIFGENLLWWKPRMKEVEYHHFMKHYSIFCIVKCYVEISCNLSIVN